MVFVSSPNLGLELNYGFKMRPQSHQDYHHEKFAATKAPTEMFLLENEVNVGLGLMVPTWDG